MKARVAHGVPLPPTEIIEALNGPVWHGLDFTQHSRGSRAKTKERQYGVVLGRRGSGRGTLLIDMVTDRGDRTRSGQIGYQRLRVFWVNLVGYSNLRT